MFGRRFFGRRYFGPRYYGDGGTAPAVDGAFFGRRYWGPRFFGPRYWSQEAAGVEPPPSPWELDVPTLGPQMAGVFSASGDFQFSSDPITAFNLVPTAPVTLSATFDASGDPVSSAAGPCDPAAIWAHVLPNGLTAAETVSQIHAMLTALTAQAPCPTASQIADAVWAKDLP
jgi:hypothetical protein